MQRLVSNIRQHLMQFNRKPHFALLCMEHHVNVNAQNGHCPCPHVYENALHGAPCQCGPCARKYVAWRSTCWKGSCTSKQVASETAGWILGFSYPPPKNKALSQVQHLSELSWTHFSFFSHRAVFHKVWRLIKCKLIALLNWHFFYNFAFVFVRLPQKKNERAKQRNLQLFTNVGSSDKKREGEIVDGVRVVWFVSSEARSHWEQIRSKYVGDS